MKEREIFSGLRVAPPVFIRVDGRGFKRAISRLGLRKPYDSGFACAMVDCTSVFFKKSGFSPVFAYLFSDEVNLFFTRLPFNGRVEKLDSVIAGFFASAFTMALELTAPVSFDARIIPLATSDVPEYLRWRQDEAWNNHVASYGYYTLIEQGLSPRDAADRLKHLNHGDLHELVFKHGVNLGGTPLWQRRGMMVYYKPLSVEGDKMQECGLVQDYAVPLFKTDEGRLFIERLIENK